MFFELIRRNSRRSRKENGLFFAMLLIAIIAFYIILSLSRQDIMLFLREMESESSPQPDPCFLCNDSGDPVFPDLFCQ